MINNFEFDLENYTNNIRLDIHLESILSNTENISLYKDNNSFIEIKIYKHIDIFQIKTIEENVENNLEKIDTNTNKINTIENNMTSLIKRNIILDKKYTIENFSENRGNNVEIFKINLDSQFSDDGILKINAKYNYTDNTNFSHVYKFYSNNTRFKEVILNHTNTTIEDEFEIKTIESSQIQIKIYLVNNDGDNRLIELYGNNIIKIEYVDNINTLKIIANKKNIASNLINANINEDNIAINTGEIQYLKKNKTYLKNLYNEIFYHVDKLKINFNSTFYDKIFNDNFAINDFIELTFKINLECDSISLLSYIKFKYEIFDQDNNSLFIKSANLNEYKHFSKYIFIDEYILYNFINNIEKIRIVITFELIINKVINLYYLKNESLNRFILKHYGL